MEDNKQTERPLSIFSKFGQALFNKLPWLLLAGIGLLCFDNLYLQRECKVNPKLCFSTPLVGNIGSTIIQAIVIIWFVDIGLKREISENQEERIKKIVQTREAEVKKIIESFESKKYIRIFFFKKKSINNDIVHDIEKSKVSSEDIKILGFFEEIDIIRKIDKETIKYKIKNGCNIKMLILHPKSSLVRSLENVGYQDSELSINLCLQRIRDIYDDLKASKGTILGSLEIRLYKDLYTPFCYYSNHELRLIWFYLYNPDGTRFPGFEIANLDFTQEAQKQFDKLWTKSSTQVLLEIQKERFDIKFDILQE